MSTNPPTQHQLECIKTFSQISDNYMWKKMFMFRLANNSFMMLYFQSLNDRAIKRGNDWLWSLVKGGIPNKTNTIPYWSST